MLPKRVTAVAGAAVLVAGLAVTPNGTGRYQGAKGKLTNIPVDDTKNRLILKFRT